MAPRRTLRTIEKVQGVSSPPEFVKLRHPALGPGAESTILQIPAYSENESAVGYVPYELLWLAGVILSNNRTDGYLTRGIAPDTEVVEPKTCLGPGNYYFHVGDRNATKAEHWATLRGLQQWNLVDEIIPTGWKEAARWRRPEPDQLPNAVRRRRSLTHDINYVNHANRSSLFSELVKCT